ncbi:MAG: autotransporter-associated beta strand repeat-containing protein [Verrucomicrobia bacterium]|nr:autotransporter-associated beta strand repeat-containing protein [Verrucomicrobiota bacterium]
MKSIRTHKSIIGILLLLAVAGFENSARAQSAGDYQTIASGAFSDITIWQKYDGANWNAATTAPTSADGVITIVNGTSVTNTASRTVDQVVVQAGGLLAVSSTLTIAHGAGTDMDVSGTFLVIGGTSSFTLAANAVVVVESGGVMVHNGSSNAGETIGAGSTITFLSGGKFQLLKSGGTIFTGVWNAGSICEIAFPAAGASKPGTAGMAQTFQNFTWNYQAQAASIDLAGSLAAVAGNFTVLAGPTNASTELKLNAGITIGGDLVIDNGSLNLAGSGGPWVWNLAGNLFIAPGAQLNLTDGASGIYTLVFNGAGVQSYVNQGANIASKLSWTVNTGSTLSLSNTAPLNTGSRTLTANGNIYLNGNAVLVDLLAGTGSIQNRGGGNGVLNLGVGGGNNTLGSVPTLTDGTSGTLGLVKSGAGSLTLTTANTFSGGVVVSNGTVLVNNASGSGTGSGTVAVTGGALGGTGIVNGAVTVQGSGSLGTGAGTIGTLTINNNVTLGGNCKAQVNTGNAQTADEFTGINTLTYGGTLTITNTGGTLTTADSFKIFNAAHYAGSFTTITPSPGAGLAWNTNTLATDGTLRIQSGVNTAPTNLVAAVSGNTLNLSWPADHTGWRLQAQTNSAGAGLGTNWVDVPGTGAANVFSVQVDATKGDVFYRMIYP